jgi:hypothetical protein
MIVGRRIPSVGLSVRWIPIPVVVVLAGLLLELPRFRGR